MSTEKKAGGKRKWLLPLLMALPFLAAIAFAAYRFGPVLLRAVNVLIKAVVLS